MKEIHEISRIKEIMGLELISEASVPSYFGQILKFLEEYFGKNPGDLENIIKNQKLLRKFEVDGGLMNFTERELLKFEQSLDIRLITKKLGEKMLDPSQWDQKFKIAVNRLRDGTKTFSEIVNDLRNAHYIENQYRYAIGDNNARIPEFIKKIDKEFSDAWIRDFKTHLQTSYPDLFKKMVPNEFKIWMRSVIDQLGNRDSQTIRRVWSNAFAPAKKLQEQFMQEYYMALEAISKKEDFSLHFKKMADILQSTKKHFRGMPAKTWVEWRKMIEETPKGKEFLKDFESSVKNPHREFFNEVLKSYTFRQALTEELVAFRRAWPIQLTSKFPFVTLKFGDKEVWKRLLAFITYGDPRTIEELRRSLQAKGVMGVTSTFITTRFVIHFVLLPGLMSLWQSLIGGLGSLAGEGITGDPKFSVLGFQKPEDVHNFERFLLNWYIRWKQRLPEGINSVINITLIDDFWRQLQPIFEGGLTKEGLSELKKYEGEAKKYLGVDPNLDNKEAAKQIINNTGKSVVKTIKKGAEGTQNVIQGLKSDTTNTSKPATDTTGKPSVDTLKTSWTP